MRKFSFAIVLVVFMLFFMSSCTDKYEAPSENIAQASESGCVGCHSDEQLLKEVADPLPPPPDDGGEG
jgi:hypothetical protein